MGTFADAARAWEAKVNRIVQAIPEHATIDVAEDVRIPIKEGGNMPVRAGNLRNSLEASLNDVPSADISIDPSEGVMLSDPMPQIVAVARSVRIGQTVNLGFRADYALVQERKHAFVRLTAQRWDQIVAAVVTRVSR